jgi:Fur family transcriptional regulator, ferric uptake regulator
VPRLSPDDSAALLERFRRHLRERRLPVTRQRLAVAGAVFTSDDHPSVDELERRVKSAGTEIGTATLYRTVQVLLESGLVRERDFGEGRKRYEPVTGAPVHDHLICERCGTVAEFSNDRLERMLKMTADEHRFLYGSHRVDVRGVCAACRSRDLETLGSGSDLR